MRLYIANPTKQNLIVSYRLPEQKNWRSIMIGAGAQEMVGGDMLTREDIDFIVDFNARYGLIPVEDIGKRGVSAPQMVYSVDKPISLAKVYAAMEAVQKALVERGVEIRTKAAVAVQQELSQKLAPVNVLEMTVVEEERKGAAPDDPGPSFAEGVIVGQDKATQQAMRGKRAR